MRRRQQATTTAADIERDEQQKARARITDMAREAAGQPDSACTRRDVAR